MSRGGEGRIPKTKCKERGRAAPSLYVLRTRPASASRAVAQGLMIAIGDSAARSRPPIALGIQPAGGSCRLSNVALKCRPVWRMGWRDGNVDVIARHRALSRMLYLDGAFVAERRRGFPRHQPGNGGADRRGR